MWPCSRKKANVAKNGSSEIKMLHSHAHTPKQPHNQLTVENLCANAKKAYNTKQPSSKQDRKSENRRDIKQKNITKIVKMCDKCSVSRLSRHAYCISTWAPN